MARRSAWLIILEILFYPIAIPIEIGLAISRNKDRERRRQERELQRLIEQRNKQK